MIRAGASGLGPSRTHMMALALLLLLLLWVWLSGNEASVDDVWEVLVGLAVAARYIPALIGCIDGCAEGAEGIAADTQSR